MLPILKYKTDCELVQTQSEFKIWRNYSHAGSLPIIRQFNKVKDKTEYGGIGRHTNLNLARLTSRASSSLLLRPNLIKIKI